MYQHFFGLDEQAFSIAVNPRYLYMSAQHREALAHLLYGIQSGGFVQLTGEVGTGKTTIVRSLLEQLPAQTDVAMILNPMASVPELLSSICDELGANYIADGNTVKTLTDALHAFLLRNHAQGRNTVLLIDEAQLLSPDALEQIRLLTNLETPTAKLLNIILVGQPELATILAQPSLRQLSQRITARFHLRPLSAAETQAYIHHRLSVAGRSASETLVPATIARKVYQFSGGIPRLINIICERMLLGAYARNTQQLDNAIFAQAEKEVRGSLKAGATVPAPMPQARQSRTWGYPLAAAAGAALIVLAGLFTGWLNPPQTDSLASSPLPQSPPQAEARIGVAELQPLAHQAEPEPTSVEPPEQSAAGVSEQPPEPEETSAAQEKPAPDAPPAWNRSAAVAQEALYRHAGHEVPAAEALCQAQAESGPVCQKARLETWDQLRELNRPVVMTLITPERKLAYTSLIGLNESQALLMTENGERIIAWAELAPLWTGEVEYLWYKPAGFQNSAGPGSSGPAVSWLAQQFAQLDGKSEPLTRDRYSERLARRVQIFQRQQQLEDDGIVGLKTLQSLNQVLGFEQPLGEPAETSSPTERNGAGI